ncbi:hypothetical protein GCM10011571_04850 [Marinithermofilum abyssi]|uniref:Uncharacterized protein n=1 Tax=Marinithermofilum abyssi TaxID=1571185 RepID=A0A8J2VG41_9BACL|nr:hypothetical protein GCM10011571_04850 [Marinithermofilum abyssi]
MFFVPIPWQGKTSIPLDHLVTAITRHFAPFTPYYALFVITLGALSPFWKGRWKNSRTEVVLSLLKLVGLAVAIMLVFQIGPAWVLAPDTGLFLFEKLVIPVGLLVPLGSIFLALLVGYGLLEFVGVWMRPVMRIIWKTPTRTVGH